MSFRDVLGKELLVFDGAMGTMLQKNGLKAGELPELWNFTHARKVTDIHLAYLQARCRIIKTNTFGANHYKLHGSGHTVEQTVKAAIANARAAIDESGSDAFVALSVGPLGKLMQPVGELSFDEAYNAFAEIMRASDGADLILCETFGDTLEIKAAVLAAKENTDLPIAATMIFDENGRLLSGGDVECMVSLLEGLGVDALGFNCGVGPKQLKTLLPKLVSVCSTPVICNPNAGLPRIENGKTVFDVEPDEFADDIRELVSLGTSCVGGCCGTTPEHLEKVAQVCEGVKIAPVEKKSFTVVSSYCKAVRFGGSPLVIGERINPTGKSKFKQALRDGDINYILGEAVSQQENGADILDVNVGLPEIDEQQMLVSAVSAVQGVSALPLQLDTMNEKAMEAALRIYNGKPMLNSVNGKAESMEKVFPLAKKYGGVVVCLTLDESGIPDTAQGRIEIAEKIIDTAAKYGIDKKNLVIDPLTITVSTDGASALTTLEALDYIKNVLGVHTVLGVSNISFGLPQRERINTAFFIMALTRGLSAGIINPVSEAMMSAYRSFCALNATDSQCMKYIEKYSVQQQEATAAKTEMTLRTAIVKGLCDEAARQTGTLLNSKDKLDIIDGDIIPALDEVGAGFEKGSLFLPQLLMAAEAARASFDVIRKAMTKTGGTGEAKGKVLLATVKGDVHDIGKNILKVLLENYGFEVIDMGKDVAPELIADAVCEQKIPIVGLSALMTTTVGAMADTIKLLRQCAPECKIMVGGAVMTQTYASMIGADFYSKDAMGAVRYCRARGRADHVAG